MENLYSSITIPPQKKSKNVSKTETYQDNGWICDNYYYEDGAVEELYRKE